LGNRSAAPNDRVALAAVFDAIEKISEVAGSFSG